MSVAIITVPSRGGTFVVVRAGGSGALALISRPRNEAEVQRFGADREGQRRHPAGNRYVARVLGEAAVSAARTDTFLGERYRRIARRRGKERAIVAVGRSILVIIWAFLSDEDAPFVDLGPNYYASRTNPERQVPPATFASCTPSYTVTLNPAA